MVGKKSYVIPISQIELLNRYISEKKPQPQHVIYKVGTTEDYEITVILGAN